MSSPKLRDVCNRCNGEGNLWDCEVTEFSPDESTRNLNIKLVCGHLVSPRDISGAEHSITGTYGINKTRIKMEYNIQDLSESDVGIIREVLSQKGVSLKKAIIDAKMCFEEGILKISVTDEWYMRIKTLKTGIEEELVKLTGNNINVEISQYNADGKTYAERRAEAEKQAAQVAQDEEKNAPAFVPQAKNNIKPVTSYIKKRDPNAVMYKPKDGDTNVIYGKPVTREMTKIADVMLDSGKVSVSGKVFYRDYRTLNGKNKTIVTFDINDDTGSIRVIKFVADDEREALREALDKAEYVTVQGLANYSTFDKETIITPSAIMKETVALRKDNAKQKRVELHLHTTMSAMDAFCETADVICLAESMGHRAVAITDHGVAQAYPDAMNAVNKINEKNKDFKILYGIEAYMVNDIDGKGAVKGHTLTSLDGEIVVFDLETTGLNAKQCEIIEIAAIIIKEEKEIARYQSYVKPTVSIPLEITKITGIDDRRVANAERIEQVLPGFLEFIGDRPLCAHNADFDISFLKNACEKMSIEREFVSIDTVTIGRALLPELKKHRLNSIAEHYGFSFNHHRALDDTEVLTKIVFKFWETFKTKYKIERIEQINDVIKECAGEKTSGQSHHIIIIAKNKQGLRSLYEMISLSHLKYFKRHPLMPLSLIAHHKKNLIIGSACEAGELYSAVTKGVVWKDLLKIASFYDYLEVQPVLNNGFMVEKGFVKNEDSIRDFNRTIIKLGEELSIPVCATGDVHFKEPADSYFREIMMTGMGFSDASNQAPLYFKTTEEMLNEFNYLGDEKAFEIVVKNTNMIADMCDVIRPIPKEQFPPKIENSARDIENMSRTKAQEIYGENLPKVVAERLEQELKSIITHGFDVMYLIAQKLVSKSISDGYLVGSRGSVGSSFVAFLTGITEVNALPPHYVCPKCKYSDFESIPDSVACGVDLEDKKCPVCGEELLKDGHSISFAVFLGFDGDKAPDIDLNFSNEYQARAHKETINLFGEDNVFRAGTIGKIKDKTAYGFVKKYLEQKGEAKSKAEENRLVQGCTGIKRTTGQHPGGLMIVPKEVSIYDFTPLQRPADDSSSDIITTHFDYHSIHDNLLKLDLLGHVDPTMIKVLVDLTGVNVYDIPIDDPQTMGIFTDIEKVLTKDGVPLTPDSVLGSTGSTAVPEFGTKFVKQMLMDTKPTSYDGLCRISGLSHGTNVWLNNAQDIIRSGKATLKNVITVRDDILAYLMKQKMEPKLAFTIMESVRKGRGLKPDWESAMREHDVPDWYIDSCKKIEYMFPRAHAVAYVMMSFRIAWFKVHYALAFYSAYFSIRAKGFDAAIMTVGDDEVLRRISALQKSEKTSGAEDDMMVTLEVCHEFYRRGYSFTSVDIYKSDVKSFIIDGDTLIPPLTAVPGVGEQAAQDIVDRRGEELFMSCEDITVRCPRATKSVVEALERVGATRALPKSNQISLF